jgi:hypothetical protein
MVLLEAALVLGLFALLVYAALRLLTRPPDQPPSASLAGEWRVAHRDKAGVTEVVVQKVSRAGGPVLDEHVIATFAVDDPDYDQKFLTAMSAARERRALFEAEEDG